MRYRDLSGLQSGRLTVLSLAGKASDGHMLWDCSCTCGSVKTIISNSLTRKNPVQSCGCINKDTAQARSASWNKGKTYVVSSGEKVYKTRHAWAKACIKHYGNKCQQCGWDKARCDVHHKHHKSDGGAHTIENGTVLCPNCHRVNHSQGSH